MNELFGYVNILTNEWADSANIVRKAVQDTTDYKKWVNFKISHYLTIELDCF